MNIILSNFNLVLSFSLNLGFLFSRRQLTVLSLFVIRIQKIAVIRQDAINLQIILSIAAVSAKVFMGLLLLGLKFIFSDLGCKFRKI